MTLVIPPKMKKGAHIRVIAPARSMAILSENTRTAARERFENMGFELSFGNHVEEIDAFNSSAVQSRVEDLHDAFGDTSVDAIFTVIGGYNSNQLLQYIDYDIIRRNPKILCGFSDITALGNAITAKTGMITYMGPHFSSWAMKHGFEYSLEYFIKCCMEDAPYQVLASQKWSDDPWYLDQEKREFIPNEGYWLMNAGKASGRIVGGHVRCLNALQGTPYWPGLKDSILILEEDEEINPSLFDRQLQSLIHQSDFISVRGIIIGRFEKPTRMTRELLTQIINSKKELSNIPVIANFDIGHTTPQATMPIGGTMEIIGDPAQIKVSILEH